MAVKVLNKLSNRLMQRSLIAAALWSISAPAFSVSLSEIDLKSGLHQPFNATILLRNFDPLESDRVGVEIANDIIQSQYNNTTYLPAPLDAKLKTTSRGTVIELTSPIAIDEPFLKFAVQLSSPTGLILRQYEVLLDPPESVYPRTKKPVVTLMAKSPKLDALEKLKASIQVTAQDRAQGIELAEIPTVAALINTPTEIVQPAETTVVARNEPTELDMIQRYLTSSLRPLASEEEVLIEVVDTVGLELPTEEMGADLFTEQEMNNAEFIAALDEYSMESLQGIEKSDLQIDQASTFIHEFAALSRVPELAEPTATDNATQQNLANFKVADSAFSSSSADSVAKELLAYRERARAGKTGGLSSRELVELSASSVNRVSADSSN